MVLLTGLCGGRSDDLRESESAEGLGFIDGGEG